MRVSKVTPTMARRPLLVIALLLGGSISVWAQEAPSAVTLRLEIHNGPQDDRYQASSRDTGLCAIDDPVRDTLAIAFRPDFPSGITWFALVVPNPLDATRGTKAFRFEAEVATLRFGRVRYVVEGRSGHQSRGSGSVTLAFDSLAATGRFAVRTGGIDLTGTVVCRRLS